MITIVNIAGTDSLGCSGLHQDLRAANAQGVHCFSVVTTVTAQNHNHLQSKQDISSKLMLEQWAKIIETQQPQAVKIGMLTDVVATLPLLEQVRQLNIPVVFDPVRSTSSEVQTLPDTIKPLMIKHILPMTTILTPNIPELEWLLGSRVENRDDIRAAAKAIVAKGCKSVLIKGGHSPDDNATDYFYDGSLGIWLASSRLPYEFRGTGCYLSTAITCSLARGLSLREAIVDGKTHLLQAFADSYELDGKRVLREQKPPQQVPLLTRTHENPSPSKAFPDIEHEPIGFYPIFPNSHWLKRLVPLGIRTAQIRIKDRQGQDLITELQESIAICQRYNCRLFINDYWQLAMELGAYGVHLGQEDIKEADIAAMKQRGLRLGVSTHSLEELSYGLSFLPSYVALGPIFPTTCKSMAFGPQGIQRVAEWVRLSPVPVVAIGGLKPEHISPLARTGAQGIALISDVTQHQNPEQRTNEWLNLMKIEGAW